MKTKVFGFVMAVGVLLVAMPVLAHHSFSSEYDQSKTLTLTGKMVNFEWVNPHSWLNIDVPTPDGKVERWKVEGGSPSVLLRLGWTRDSFPIGAKIKVTGAPAKDGAKPKDRIAETNLIFYPS